MITVNLALFIVFLTHFPINSQADMLLEYRIPMALDVDSYEIALLNTVIETSLKETGGGEGVEFVNNEKSNPFGNWPYASQYTYKIWHLNTKVPRFVRMLAPTGSLELEEYAWNSYPRTKTAYKNKYMDKNFHIIVTSIYKPDNCDSENVHELPASELSARVVDVLDIVNDPIEPSDYDPRYDPTLCMSSKTGLGKLKADWRSTSQPIMCAYKLFEIKFNWWGTMTKVENIIKKGSKRILTKFNRYLYCTQDTWVGMSMEEIRRKEKVEKEELTKLRHSNDVRGMKIK